MAQQVGPWFFTGSMGGATGYKRNGKYLIKTKNVITRDTALNSPRFARTRENAKEWRRAVRAGMLVRYSLRHLIKHLQLADNPISGRLNAWMNKIIKSDPVSDRGERRISNGQLELLEDFAFREAPFNSVCTAGPVSSIDMATGKMKVELRSFDPALRIQLPEGGATHFKIVLNGAAIDFEKEQFQSGCKETDYLSMEDMTAPICLEQTLVPAPGQALLVAIGVVFYVQGEGGRYERVNGGGMRVLQASPGPSGGGELVAPEVIDETSGLEVRVADCSADEMVDEMRTGLQAEVMEDTMEEVEMAASHEVGIRGYKPHIAEPTMELINTS